MLSGSFFKKYGFVVYWSITIQTDFGVCILFYQRSDPFKSRKRETGDCPLCREDGKGPCDGQSVTYNIKFAECNVVWNCVKTIKLIFLQSWFPLLNGAS